MKPTSYNFKNYFKSLLIKNFVSGHSLGANCENFEREKMLFKLEIFLTQGREEKCDVTLNECNFTVPHIALSRNVDLSTIGYVSGFIAKTVLNKIHCEVCKTHIIAPKGK